MKVERNVLLFIEKCAKEIGKAEVETFEQDTINECLEYGSSATMQSPIEHILYTALKTIRQLNGFKKAEPCEINGKTYIFGLGIFPQVKVEKYRVDFHIICNCEFINMDGSQKKKEVIVECDSQTFHERTEKERRYEKQRDRYLQIKGYKVFHFTGSEIVKNPLKIAREIISFLSEEDIEDLLINSGVE